MFAAQLKWLGSVVLGATLGFVFIGGHHAEAVVVETELLMLVDATKSVSDAEFALMMSGYADAFESSDVIAGLENGSIGSIAAAMVFYADKNSQAVGVDWMEISNVGQAEAFADLLRGTTRPFNKNKTSIAGALDFAVPLFGTETGAASNGFESTNQRIQVTGEGVDDNSKKTDGSRDQTVADARDTALTSGVDVINALTVGAVGTVDDYFAQYVVGGSVGAEPALVTNAEDFNEFGVAANTQLLVAVPEPGTVMGLVAGAFMIGWRRRRGYVE